MSMNLHAASHTPYFVKGSLTMQLDAIDRLKHCNVTLQLQYVQYSANSPIDVLSLELLL